MIRAERFNLITRLSSERDVISLEELAELMNVSVATVRRDVDELSEQGHVQKTRGGVIYSQKARDTEPSLKLRQFINMDEKKRIAEAAYSFISPHTFCMIDSGSTTLELLKLIPKDMMLSLVSYDLSHVPVLNDMERADVFILGGLLRNGQLSCHGIYAEGVLDRMNAQIAFLGADSIDVTKGIMGFNTDDVALKQKMIANSDTTILLCDHSKFSNRGFISISNFDGIDRIITDSGTSPTIIQQLRQQGITVDVV